MVERGGGGRGGLDICGCGWAEFKVAFSGGVDVVVIFVFVVIIVVRVPVTTGRDGGGGREWDGVKDVETETPFEVVFKEVGGFDDLTAIADMAVGFFKGLV